MQPYFQGVTHIQMSQNLAHILITPSTLIFSKQILRTCKNVLKSAKNAKKWHILLILPTESSSQTNIMTKHLVNVMKFFYCYGVFLKKTPVELKLIPSAQTYSRYRLNNSNTTISAFAESSILSVSDYLLERNSKRGLSQIEICHV